MEFLKWSLRVLHLAELNIQGTNLLYQKSKSQLVGIGGYHHILSIDLYDMGYALGQLFPTEVVFILFFFFFFFLSVFIL